MSHRFAILIAAAVPLLAGCGSDDLLRPEGTASIAGAPVDAGSLVFVPAGGHSSPTGSCAIEAGEFVMGPETGIKPGEFRVTLRMPVGPRKGPAPGAGAPADPMEAIRQAMENAPPSTKTYALEIEITEQNAGVLTLDFSEDE
ncbi:MAG: hypothetical protein AAF907_13000 [Planctomycetota bacterium]